MIQRAGMHILTMLLLCAMAMAPFGAYASAIEREEIREARELQILPHEWETDLQAPADFVGFYQMLSSLIASNQRYDEVIWQNNVRAKAFPKREMRRDDGLVLLLLAAEAMNYNCYNARESKYCTENRVNYDTMFSQLSMDYPYCNTKRTFPIYFNSESSEQDPIGDVAGSSLFWFQRRMDLTRNVHFLDGDQKLDFHLDQPLSRSDAVAAVVRLYDSRKTEFHPSQIVMRQPGPEGEALLSAADEARQRILSNTDQIPCKGKAYYVSNSGDDKNNGLSPSSAWASLAKVSKARLSPGDCVYFERGGTWRGQLFAQEKVSYSAYGDGDKPRIFASPEDGADPAKWSLLDGTDNIWVYDHDLMDCGQIVFNDGESWGKKVTPRYLGFYRSLSGEDAPFDVRTELNENHMFFSRADSILYDGAPFRYRVMDWCDFGEYSEVTGPLYLRCDEGNPGSVFSSIEFAVRQNIIVPANDAVFNNLCLRYTGAHAIFGGEIGYNVSFCEIGWIGGSPQHYDEWTGEAVLLGNGVECDGSYDHFSVTDCWIYQCYDAGVSNQDPTDIPDLAGRSQEDMENSVQRNITYARNVFEYNDMPVEIFFRIEDDTGYGRHRMENVLIEDNYFMYTGYGWYSETKPYPGNGYMGHACPNASENFVIKNNVFYLSTGALLQTGAPKKWQPRLDGNIYVQNEGGILIEWPDAQGNITRYIYYYDAFYDQVTDVIRSVLGDRNGRALRN